jgi:hypothetical protein
MYNLAYLAIGSAINGMTSTAAGKDNNDDNDIPFYHTLKLALKTSGTYECIIVFFFSALILIRSLFGLGFHHFDFAEYGH